MELNLYSSLLLGFSLFQINSQPELQWKKKETIFVQDNLSEEYEILGVFGNRNIGTQGVQELFFL